MFYTIKPFNITHCVKYCFAIQFGILNFSWMTTKVQRNQNKTRRRKTFLHTFLQMLMNLNLNVAVGALIWGSEWSMNMNYELWIVDTYTEPINARLWNYISVGSLHSPLITAARLLSLSTILHYSLHAAYLFGFVLWYMCTFIYLLQANATCCCRFVVLMLSCSFFPSRSILYTVYIFNMHTTYGKQSNIMLGTNWKRNLDDRCTQF